MHKEKRFPLTFVSLLSFSICVENLLMLVDVDTINLTMKIILFSEQLYSILVSIIYLRTLGLRIKN